MHGLMGQRRFLAAILAAILTEISVLPALASAAKGWPADLDWAPLEARLSEAGSLVDTSFADWQSECLPEYDEPSWMRTSHALIDQPSGMCVVHLSCAYERCYPRPDADGHAGTTLLQRLGDMSVPFDVSLDDLSAEIQGWLEDPSNPALNLPSKVLFPAVASDVVAAIDFARENGLEVSVKNSGHSYIGASTKRDTLHINMNRFQGYAPTGIVECGGADEGDAACALAEARGKPGYIRVGGGENWDKTYRAVTEFNELGGKKFHVVGGAAGTVSPMGWTFQGGLSGTTGGSGYGFGVDQVLHIEMVLPNGLHVKFGPAEWEDATADGFVAPKTTSVAGLCRSNPDEADENAWEWGPCPKDGLGVDFDDLWYAVSGGGGGTWGVVTSIYLQLHDYLPSSIYEYNFPSVGSTLACNKIWTVSDGAMPIYLFETFRVMFFFFPSDLNVTQADSDACGAPDDSQSPRFYCLGQSSYQNMLDAWETFLTTNQDQLTGGVTVDDMLACATEIRDTVEWRYIPWGPYAGRVASLPQPGFGSQAENLLNVLVPKQFIENNFYLYMGLFVHTNLPGGIYYSFGSGTTAASDQANSLSDAHRGAGAKVWLDPDVFYGELFHLLYDTSDKSNFPGFQGSNHVGNNMMGPLKDDWTKACPLEWTLQEREEKCVSIQETIYGTKSLRRLEAIKEALDPDYMFDCNGCIGNNRAKEAPDTPSSPTKTTRLGLPFLREQQAAF